MSRKAFTLIEILTVTAITALLTAVLMPCVYQVRRLTRTTVCTSNIRQVNQMVFMYQSDNGTFPFGLNTEPFLGPPPGGYLAAGRIDSESSFGTAAGWW